MAQRRMFSLQIVDTDAFLEMPTSSQLLYFHLAMRADDDGFVANPKKIIRVIGTQEDDYKILIAKRFLLTFESGVVVIKHWKIHNYIQNDRYTQTKYVDERENLTLKDNGSYTERIQNGYKLDTQVRLGKVSKGKVRLDTASLENLKKTFFENPLMEKIQRIYPDRDYDFQFDLMIDWWKKSKKKYPQNLSAFSNWLKNTKPDELIQAERRRKIEREDLEKKHKMLIETPRANDEKIQEMRNKMNGIAKII